MKPSSADDRWSDNAYEAPGLELLSRVLLQGVAHQSVASTEASHDWDAKMEAEIRQEEDSHTHASASISTEKPMTTASSNHLSQETSIRQCQRGANEHQTASAMSPEKAGEAASANQQQPGSLHTVRHEEPKTSAWYQQHLCSNCVHATPLSCSHLKRNIDVNDPSFTSRAHQPKCQKKLQKEPDSNLYIGRPQSPVHHIDSDSEAGGESSCAVRKSREGETPNVQLDMSRTRADNSTNLAGASISSTNNTRSTKNDSRGNPATGIRCPQGAGAESRPGDDDQQFGPPNSCSSTSREEHRRVSASSVPPVREIRFVKGTSSFHRLHPLQPDKYSLVVKREGTSRRWPLGPVFARPLAPPPALWNPFKHGRIEHRGKRQKTQQPPSPSSNNK